VEYHLFSVVVHSGYSSDGGHYYTWARAADSGSWLVLNDSLVTEVSGEQFAQMARWLTCPHLSPALTCLHLSSTVLSPGLRFHHLSPATCPPCVHLSTPQEDF